MRSLGTLFAQELDEDEEAGTLSAVFPRLRVLLAYQDYLHQIATFSDSDRAGDVIDKSQCQVQFQCL